MIKRLILVAAIAVSLFGGVLVKASDVTDALWLGIVQVSNNGTAATGVSVNFTANTTSFITGGFMNSSGNNTAMQYSGSDVAYMPGFAGNPWVVFVNSINQNELQNDSLYMGGATDMAAKLSYFPASGGMTVVDNASLEPGANFTISMTDTYVAPAGDILYKLNAFNLREDSATQVMLWSGNEWVTPTSINGTGWTNPNNAFDNNTGTFADQVVGGTTWSNYFYFNPAAANWDGYVRIYPDRANPNLTTMEVDGFNGVWISIYSGTPTYGAWNDLPIPDEGGYRGFYPFSQIRVRFYAGGGASQAYLAEFDFGEANFLIITGTYPSENDITVTADSVNTWFQVGSTSSGNASVRTIYDNSNNWTWGGTGTSYIGTMRQTVGGVEKGEWEWEYAATFTDQSGTSNTGTPTFRTTSSDADVSATLLEFAPIVEADAPTYSVDEPPDFITAAITATGNFTTNMTGPGAEIITAVSNSSNTPVNFVVLTISLIVLVVLAYLMSWLMRKANTESQLIRGLVIVGFFGLLLAIHAIDSLVFYFFAFLAVGIVAVSKSRDMEGTGNTNNNMFGFLIMSWLGMTMINRILEGSLITTAERSIMNSITVFQPWNVFGIFTLPVPNIGFLTTGVPALMRWDYSFFGGSGQILTYLMYSITGVVAVVFLGYALSSASSIFARSR